MFSGSKGVRPHLLNEITAVCITVCNTLQRISFQHLHLGTRDIKQVLSICATLCSTWCLSSTGEKPQSAQEAALSSPSMNLSSNLADGVRGNREQKKVLFCKRSKGCVRGREKSDQDRTGSRSF